MKSYLNWHKMLQNELLLKNFNCLWFYRVANLKMQEGCFITVKLKTSNFESWYFQSPRKFWCQNLLRHTATFTINRHLACLWSKIGTFQLGIELCKRATLPILRGMFRNTNESFQMSYCMQFFFQGHQNCQNLKIYTFEFT